MKFWPFVCSLLVFFNVTILICGQSQPICLTGDKAKEVNDRLIEEHNKYRKCHSVPPLVADDALMQDSIEWSKQLTFKKHLEHSPKKTRKGGENLAYYFVEKGIDVSKYNPVQEWYDEIKDYHGSFTHGTGHFTQVVWKASQKVGCGVCLNSESTKIYATCRYLPGGNVEGKFEENVPPRRPNCGDRGNTSNQPSTTTVNSNPSWDTEKTLVFITISTHAILGLAVVITLSAVVYYYAISHYHL